MKMKNVFTKYIAMVITVVVVLGVLPGAVPAYANSKISELENEKEALSDQKQGIETEKNESQKIIDDLENQKASVETKVKELDGEITTLIEEISSTEHKIDQKSQEIMQLEEDIKILEERIQERDQLLKERAKTLQVTGGNISYFQVLLGAESFADFLSRATAVTTLIEADNSILEEHERDQKDLHEKKELVVVQKEELETLKTQLEGQKASVQQKKAKEEEMLAQLELEVKRQSEYIMSLEEEQRVIANQEAAIQKAIQLEQQRIEEEKRRPEEARKAAEAASAPAISVNSGFIRPTSGVVTSNFGYRWGSMHYGTDFGVSTGTPVYAAASGVVSNSYYSTSYGNVIFITHSINGQIFETVYAHLSSRGVSVGDVVSQGQYIGASGNTGQSTGPHLHLELHRGRWNGSKSNAVNSRNYIAF
ncbi:peptidoglycan DD-metalloendopeptidase family protein [Caldifermentibacillus hisashii]|uniref:murein hydrolase activator EnvC family protein n=1 Tax=Caldifermentibacillus hisashii TaxID=996558 RepID=UPI003D25AA10